MHIRRGFWILSRSHKWLNLQCQSVWKDFSWQMQNQNFAAEVFVLPLDNYDLTLGEEWLATLGYMVSCLSQSIGITPITIPQF